MNELSPKARELFEAGRRSLRPTTADRERVLAALSARVGGLEPQRGETAGTPKSASGLGWPTITALVFGVALAGAGLRQVLRPAASHAVVTAPTITALAPPSAVAPPAAPAPPEATAPVAGSAEAAVLDAPRGGGRATASAPPSDRLAEEVAILSEAERDLHAGQYQSALRLLDEHRRKFPNGTLAQERMAARVQALCGLGRVTEAQAALGRLTRLSPNSPHEDSAREACAAKN
ncbi:MAG TPA: hypothetical protein VMI54_28845 [Polyangiaceae bacterium]|nr:hypothetical protein [Polyangiaceae bacterium]